MSQWYYTKDKKAKIGPISFDVLQQLTRGGHLLPADMVQQAGAIRWVRADSVAGLFPTPPSQQECLPEIALNAPLAETGTKPDHPTGFAIGASGYGVAMLAGLLCPPLGVVVIVSWLGYGWYIRCPSCRRWWATQRLGTVSLGKKQAVSEAGEALGLEETVGDGFQCRFCSDNWMVNPRTTTLDVCPKCEKSEGVEHVGDRVIGQRQGIEYLPTTHDHYVRDDSGIFIAPKYGGTSYGQVPVALVHDYYRMQFRCRCCGEEWQSQLLRRRA